MKHLKVFIGILIFAMLLTACGGNATEEMVPASAEEATETSEEEAPAPTEETVEEATLEEETEDEAAGSLSIAGSTTVQPVAELLAEAFMVLNPGIEVTVAGGGSSTGVKSVAEGQVEIGNASREIKDSEMEEYPGLLPHAVAKDGVAIVVHPSNPVSDLTAEQVKAIFLGQIQNWSEVGGHDKMIIVVVREEGSGTRATFDELALDEELPTDFAVVVSSNGNMVTTVSTTEDAIGYVSFGYMDEATKGVAVDGNEPTTDNVISGVYPISRNLNMITMGEAEGLAKTFLDFVLSAEGQAIVVEEGFIAVK
ncbi:MAG: phosphate ABC transporter substrate-binding protein [Anaerolineaceae bacterium]|nr:phosphate ABC transporter substrate-binding protein [Anaerolineaceae bacterium]